MYKRKLKDGRAEYVDRYRDPLTGKTKYVTVAVKPQGKRAEERAARDALDKKIAAAMAKSGQPETITLAEVIRQRVAWERANLKPQSAASAEMHLRTAERLIGGDVLAEKLNAGVIADRLSSDGPDPIKYNERLKNLKACLRWAYRADLIADVSYLGKLLPAKAPTAREKDKYKYLEHGEITALLEGMAVERWRLLTEFLILSGLRIGEAIALENADVDIKNRKITVSKTYSMNVQKVTSTKTETSEREIYMQEELMDCCRRIKQFVRLEEMEFGYRSTLFLPDQNTGSYIQYTTYGKYFRENTEHILGRRLTPHSLRHTHTAMLAEAGIPLDDISRRLGHADSRITRDVYMHVTEKMKQKCNDRINDVKIVG